MVWVYIGATVPRAVYLCHLEIRIFFFINVVEMLKLGQITNKKKLETKSKTSDAHCLKTDYSSHFILKTAPFYSVIVFIFYQLF